MSGNAQQPLLKHQGPLGPLSRLTQALSSESLFGTTLIAPMQLLLWFLLIIPTLIVIYLSFVAWEPRMGVDWWQGAFRFLAKLRESGNRRALLGGHRTLGSYCGRSGNA